LQQTEFAAAEKGFTAVKHQREVGTSYFDEITQIVTGGTSSTTALRGSTEEEQFVDHTPSMTTRLSREPSPEAMRTSRFATR
jgi:isocitrate lyase